MAHWLSVYSAYTKQLPMFLDPIVLIYTILRTAPRTSDRKQKKTHHFVSTIIRKQNKTKE